MFDDGEATEKTHEEMDNPVWENLDIAQDLLWDHAITYVRSYIKSIMTYAQKFRPYSPYLDADFIQEAYLAAFHAHRLSLVRGKAEMLDRYFWVHLKSQYCKMATDPSLQDLLGGEAPGAPCIFQEYHDTGTEEHQSADQSIERDPESHSRQEEDREIEARENRALSEGLARMTQKERQVWELLLGNNGGIPKLREIAFRMGITRQRVQALRDRGLKKVKAYFAEKGIASEKGI